MRFRIPTILTILLLTPFVLSALLLAAFQVPAVRAKLLTQLSEFTADQPIQIQIENLLGRVPDAMQVQHIRLSDSQGPWLEIHGLTLDWSPIALMTGKIEVTDLNAKRIVLRRLPELPPSPEESPEEKTTSLQWPLQLPDLVLRRLTIETIELAPAVAGKALALSLMGEAHSDPVADHTHVRLNLTRKDVASPLLAISIMGKKGLNLLDLNLQIDDVDGLLSHLAALPKPQPLAVSLTGKGSLNDWRGRLTVRAKALANLESSIALDLLERGRIELDGWVRAASEAVPTELASFMSDGLAFNTQVDGVTGEKISIHQLQFKAEKLVAEIQGTVNPQTRQMDLRLDANAAELERFSSLTGMSLAGSVDVKTTAQGSVEQPELQLSIKGQNLRLEAARIADLQAALHMIPESAQTLKIRGSGHIQKIRHPALSGPLDNATWQLDALIERLEQITLQNFDLRALGAELDARGNYNLALRQGLIKGRLNAPDLATLTPLLGTKAAGEARLNITLNMAQQLQNINARLDASGSKLSGLPAPVAALTGESVHLETRLQLEPDQSLTVQALQLNGENLAIDGTLLAGLPDGTLDGRLNLSVMDLAPFSTAAGQSVAGTLQSTLTLAGEINAPRMQLKTVGKHLIIDERDLGEVVLDAELTGADKRHYEGTVLLYAKAPEGELNAAVDFLVEPTRYALRNLRILGPGIQASGQLADNLPATLPSGNLQGEILDLARLSPWLGQGYAGRIRFALDAPADNPQQRATVTAEVDGLQTPFGQLKQLRTKLEATNVLTTPRLNAEVTLNKFANNTGLGISQLEAKTEGPLDRLRISTNLRGRHQDNPFQLDTRAALEIETESFGAEVSWLQAGYGEIPINLDKPIKLYTAADGQIRLDPFELRFGNGRLKATGELSASRTEATLNGKLPLTMLKTFGYPDIEGTTSVDARLTGSPIDPRIQASVQLVDFKINSEEQNRSAIELNAEALFENGTAHLQLQTIGLAQNPGEMRLKLPLRLSLSPFSLELPMRSSIEGKVDQTLALDRFTQALSLGDPELAGLLHAQFDISGTLTEPLLTGSASLTQGRFISALSGTYLENFKLDLIAQARQILIREFSAQDGNAGHLNLVGEVNLDVLDNPEFYFRLDLQRAHLVQRPEADATLSGFIETKGALQELNLIGQVTVDQAEIAIPGNSGPSIPELAVTEMNVPGEESGKTGETTSKIALDIAINMPGRLFVRGRGLDSEWSGKLSIKGTVAKPSVLGNISVRRGRFDFLDQRFELRKGLIQFSGAIPPEPYIDLEAAAELTDMTAIVGVRGLATRPDLELSAEPALPQDEILSRILFKRDLNTITPIQVAQLASAVNQLRGSKGIDPMASLRKFTSLDTLDVGMDESGDVSLTAGKYLDDKTFIQFKPSIGATSSKLRIERELSRRLSAEAELEDDGGSSMGLSWKRDY